MSSVKHIHGLFLGTLQSKKTYKYIISHRFAKECDDSYPSQKQRCSELMQLFSDGEECCEDQNTPLLFADGDVTAEQLCEIIVENCSLVDEDDILVLCLREGILVGASRVKGHESVTESQLLNALRS